MNIMYRLYILIAMIAAAAATNARTYFDTPHLFTQPDGQTVEARLYGDELYIDAESADHYTLIRDEQTGYICYAMLSADGDAYASTGIPYTGGATPEAVQMIVSPKVRISSKARSDIAADNASLLGKDISSQPILRVATVLPDTVYGLCLLIDFADTKFTVTREEIETFLNSDDETVYSNAMSIKKYFQWISSGKLTYINLLPRNVYHAPGKFTDYSPADATGYTTDRFYPIITDAMLAIDKGVDGFDLHDLTTRTTTDYWSGTKTGIRAINVFYAGDGPSKWATGLWPHYNYHTFDLTPAGFDRDAKHYYQMSNLGKDLSMGTFVHENGHLVLEFPDFYSYEESNDDNNEKPFNIANTFWTPNDKKPDYPNPYSLDNLGWLTDKQDITNYKNGRKVTLKKGIGHAAVIYGKGNNSKERYYLEVRTEHYKNYWAKDNKGVMIWHVNEDGENDNHNGNNYAGRDELLDCRPATPNDCMWNSKNGPAIFSDNSDPSARWHTGETSGVYLWDFSAPGEIMTFRCGEASDIELSFPEPHFTDGEADKPYLITLEADGGEAPYSYSIADGTLPDGLTLSPDGKISGTPTTGGTSHFTLTVTDSRGSTATTEGHIHIRQITLVATLTFDVTLAPSATQYTSEPIDLTPVATALGLSPSEFASMIDSDVTFAGISSDDALSTTYTSGDGNSTIGYWYDTHSDVTSWAYHSVTCAAFAEITKGSTSISVGQYPGINTHGTTRTIRQAYIYGEKRVDTEIRITFVDPSISTALSTIPSAVPSDAPSYNAIGQPSSPSDRHRIIIRRGKKEIRNAKF